ncbi:MAG: hypothetical protein WC401_02245 [Bacteroidales bacterium]|jgi:hypothetical protein
MSGKIVTAEGKEVEMTQNLEDLSRHACEDYDMLRSGQIDVSDAMARAALIRSVIATEMLGITRAKLMREKPDSKFLGMEKSKELKS